MNIIRGIDKKLTIQPVFGSLIHNYVFEGPCRFGSGDQLTAEYDRLMAAEAFKYFKNDLNKWFDTKQFELLEPVYFERSEEFGISRETIRRITEHDSKADIYLFGSQGRIYDIILEVAKATNKPIANAYFCCANTQVAAMLINRGYECYTSDGWEGLVKKLRVLRVRKVLKEARVLLLTRGNSTMAVASSCDAFISLEDATRNIGPSFRYMDIHEFLDMTSFSEDGFGNHTLPTRHGMNINSEDMNYIDSLADELIAGADFCNVKKEFVVNSLKYYRLMQKVLEHEECCAYTAPCPEQCATTRLNKEKFTPCFCHALMGENGIPGGCEYDIPGVITELMLSNFSFSGAYMGNTIQVTLKEDNETLSFHTAPYNGLEEVVKTIDPEDRKNLICTFHSVPNRKMQGFDTEPAPYRIRPFTSSGWGASMRRNFDLDKEQVITLARFSPDAKAVMVARGVIKGTTGWEMDSCTAGVVYSVKDRKDFFEKQLRFGNHMSIVYGDVFDDVAALGKLLNLEVVTA